MPLSNQYTITDTLYESNDIAVYRAKKIKDGISVIVKMLKPSIKDEALITPFTNELQMLSMLRSDRVANLIDSIHTPSEYFHIFEDIGGKTLYEYLDVDDFSFGEALYIAIELTKTLEYLYSKNVIHTAINPKSIVYNPERRIIRLINFGHAISDNRHTNMVIPVEKSIETIWYIAPEQTGRTLQKIDHRTDLYSLGMTLYHLFSGELPFSGSDVDDVVHKQLAMTLPSLDTLKKPVPKVISAIIHKLIEKKPEQRYQSVHALLFDLVTCQEKWAREGEIADFEIATIDRPSLMFGEHLYGRENELQMMDELVEKALSPSSFRVLIAGPSGIGKTRLAEELITHLYPLKAHLIRSKFDQYRIPLPYAAFRDFFEQLSFEWLGQKNGVKIPLDDDSVDVLRQMFPELKLILPIGKIAADNAHYDFHHQLLYAVNQLFAYMVNREFPLIFFIDDIQWADQSSIELISHLLDCNDNPYLHFIGNYRDVEVQRNRWALKFIDHLTESKPYAIKIQLQPLSLDEIYLMVSHLLNSEGNALRELAVLLEKKTGGNLFYIKSFLEHLIKTEVLEYSRGKWFFGIDKLLQSTMNMNIGELIKEKFDRLKQSEKTYLQYLSLWGDRGSLKEAFDAMTTFYLLNNHMKRLDTEGFIEINNGKYKFVHDQIQQFVYMTLSLEMKRKIHLQIGKYLDQKYQNGKRDIITIVSHLNKGYPPEKFPKKLYAMNLDALELLLQRNAYTRALREIRWMEAHGYDGYLSTHRPLLAFRLGILKTRTLYLNGLLIEAEQQIHMLIKIAKTPDQKFHCFRLYKDICVTQGVGYPALLEYAKELFQESGLDIPTSHHMLQEAIRQLQLGIVSHPKYGRIQDSSKFSVMQNRAYKRMLDVLVEAWEVAYYLANVELMEWMYLTIIDYSLRFGYTSASAFGYVLYGAKLVSEGEYSRANEFGQLALAINKHFKDAVMLPKVHNFVANFISPYTKHIQENVPLYEKSLYQSKINGDIVFGTWANFLIHLSNYFSGYSLDELLKEMLNRSSFLMNSGDQKMISMFNFLVYTVKKLQDLPTIGFEEERMVSVWESEQFYPGLAWYAVIKAQNSFLSGMFESGLRTLERHIHSELNQVIMFPKIRLHFVRILLLLGVDMPLSETQKRVLHEDLDFFDRIVSMSPNTFKIEKLILKAEREKDVQGVWKTSQAYDKALEAAKKNKNSFYIAITGLCASRFWKKSGFSDMALFYQNEAIIGLNQWGAYTVVESMQRGKETRKAIHDDMNNEDEFNYQTLVKSFIALSKTIDKTEVLKTLLQLIVEHATASRAVLVFKEKGNFIIYADLKFTHNSTDIMSTPLDEYTTIAKTMLNYAINTAETVISEEPYKTGKFKNDEYLAEKQLASCIVIPVVLEGEVNGLLYLENDEISTPLSSQSIKTLELLLTQAAIVFNNALLFTESKKVEEELNKAQEISRVGSWKYNSHTQKIEWSAETYRIYDMQPYSAEITNEWFFQHLRLEDRERIEVSVEMAMNNEKPYDVIHPIITAKGKEKIVHQRAEVFWNGNIQMMAGTIQDITQSKKAEDLIARLSQVVNQNPFSTIITDSTGTIEYVNPQCLNMTGFFERELVGKRMNVFRSGVHSESFYAGLWNTISKEKKLWQGTIVNRMKDGSMVDCASTIFPIFDQNHTIVNYVTIQENVTEQNLRDKMFIMQTRQAQMGEMLSMIAHQWRQPLAVIGTLLTKERVNLVLKGPNEDELMQSFDDIEYQVQHLSRTISDFRDFFKPDKERIKTRNSIIVAKTISLIEHMLKQKHISITQVHEQDEEYTIYEHEMVQVLLNLIKNAQDAYEEKNISDRKMIITTSQHRGYAIITVEDNAGGISASVQETLFLPYVTTKNEHNGTGLGLYMSKTIVEDHCEGKLEVENTLSGAKFTIKIPLKVQHD